MEIEKKPEAIALERVEAQTLQNLHDEPITKRCECQNRRHEAKTTLTSNGDPKAVKCVEDKTQSRIVEHTRRLGMQQHNWKTQRKKYAIFSATHMLHNHVDRIY